jgi:hypothetical protein
MSRHGIQSERQAKLKLENQLAALRALKKQMRRLSQLRSAQTREKMIEDSAPSPRDAQRRYVQSRSGRIQFVIRFHLFG